MHPNKKLIEKHRPLSKKEVVKGFKEMADMKKSITTDAAVLEQNLKKFNKTADPLVDPETGLALCWIRRPTNDELEALIPAELLEYRNDPESVPPATMEKYRDFQFDMMAELITNPEHDSKWWKANSNQVFQRLFQIHLSGVLEDLGISAENF